MTLKEYREVLSHNIGKKVEMKTMKKSIIPRINSFSNLEKIERKKSSIIREPQKEFYFEKPDLEKKVEEPKVESPKENRVFIDDMAVENLQQDNINEFTSETKFFEEKVKNRDSFTNDTNENSNAFINLSKDLLLKIYEANNEPLNMYEKILDDNSEMKLQIYMKSYSTPEKNKVNVFRSQYIAPCSPEFFINFINDIEENKKLDNNLNEFYIHENIKPNLYLIYLSYKKILISSPRDFFYLKHYKYLEKENVWLDVTSSVEDPKCPPKVNTIRGDIILSGYLLQNFNSEHNCLVRLYSECDFKTNIPTFLTKSMSTKEIKKYVEKCISRIKQLYKK